MRDEMLTKHKPNLELSFQFNLNCDKEFYLSLIGTINNIGQLFCYLLTGFLSDRYFQLLELADAS